MAAFSEPELAYLHGERRLGRLATVGKDGTPHVVPVGWRYNAEHDTIEIGGRDNARTKKGALRAPGGRRSSSTTSPASTRGGRAGSRSAAERRRWTATGR